MPSPLSLQALDLLALLECADDSVKIPSSFGQLDRALYEEVDECLRNLGGKWHRSKRLHLFPYPAEPLIQAVIETGSMPPRNPTAFFPTPASLVQEMLDCVDLNPFWDSDVRILEPSAGTGAIAKAIRERAPNATLHVCEFLPVNRRVLEREGFELVAEDFTEYTPAEPYDVIVMNPPFSLDGDKTAYITHINRAWSMLAEGGKIAAITPLGWSYGSAKKVTQFREFVCDWLSFAEVGAGAFADSGTQVNTYLLWGEKCSPRTEPHNGWRSYHAWQAALWIDNSYDLYRRVRDAGNRAQFEGAVREAERQLLKDGVPVLVRADVMEELWEHYSEEGG